MPEFNIGSRTVGDGHPPLVIAEIGINHGGSLETARLMVDSAARAGAEIVKHQTHFIEDEMSPSARDVIPGNATTSIWEIMEKASLSPAEESQLKSYTETSGITYLSTPFSRSAADFLQSLGVLAFKIGSGECNNYPLVEHIARFGKPVILSTGMNSVESIRPSVEILRARQIPFALLHCTNVYPTPQRLVRLGAMIELKDAFPDAVIGLSDHTLSNNACLAAVALGAAIVERHFTDTRERIGPDIACSMDERDLRDLIRGTIEVADSLGGSKGPVSEEGPTMAFAFSTAVAIRDIAAGEALSLDNLWLRRPAVGEIGPSHFPSVLGKSTARAISKGTHLRWEDISL